MAAPQPDAGDVAEAARRLEAARRPLMVIGSQAMLDVASVGALRQAVERLGVPVFLSGMARGLLGAGHRLQFRHKRREALREADLVILAGVPCDFRLADAAAASEGINPLKLCGEIEALLPEDSVVVADGGDFVATASYILRPRGPLRWLDPGVFGTLGVGAGFILGAKLCRPQSEVWALFGDGALGYSLMEFDTFVRHGIPLVAVVGNDACWTQIAREQVEVLKDDVGCPLRPSDYHLAAAGLGARGLVIRSADQIAAVLGDARRQAQAGHPVLVNALLGGTDFRKGSISM